MRLFNKLFLLVFSAAAVCGCDELRSSKNEIVVCPGSTIKHRLGDDVLTISAPSVLRRIYQTKDVTVEGRMIPRGERWFGSFGVYTPTGTGDVHLTADEGFQYFNSEKEFREWLEFHGEPLAYTSGGLVLGWRYGRRPKDVSIGPEAAMSVDLYQVYIGGVKPKNLAGATDRDFAVNLKGAACSKPEQFFPNRPKTMDGLKFTGRALDILAERGLEPSQVKELVAHGRRNNENGLVFYYNDEGFGDVQVAGLNRAGEIALVMK